MLLLIVLAVLAIVAFGVGFTIHWLFIVAAVLALIWVISLLTGGSAVVAAPGCNRVETWGRQRAEFLSARCALN
jgi:hypothetical protein